MKMIATASGLIDLARMGAGERLLPETTLETAVIVSLLTDRRAAADDALPDAPSTAGIIPPDRRGWCGDAFDPDRPIGSRLWLLQREKQTEETRRRAIFYAREALQWLVDDSHAVSISVSAEWAVGGRLNMRVVISLPEGGTFETTVKTGGVHALEA